MEAVARFGIGRIDGPLGGGLLPGIMADVYGPPASGKTQLAYQACAGAASAGRPVLFVDTKGEFRPERIRGIAGVPDGQHCDLLDRIRVVRATTSGAQMLAIQSMGERGLAVVDGVTDLFTSEYDAQRGRPGARRWSGRHRRFAEYARALSHGASMRGSAVVITNTVRASADNRQVESLGAAVSLFAHARMRLEPCAGPDARWTEGELATLGARSRFAFEITDAGVVEREPGLAGGEGAPDAAPASRRADLSVP